MPTKITSSAILDCQRRIPIALAPLASFFERVRRELSFPENGVTVRLISDPAMARLNLFFRGKRGPTDVLSFPSRAQRRKTSVPHRSAFAKGTRAAALDPDERKQARAYVGDIAISPRTAERNARAGSRTLQAELRILILHGMIHLAGYDHETDHGEMTRLEMRLRRRLNLIGCEPLGRRRVNPPNEGSARKPAKAHGKESAKAANRSSGKEITGPHSAKKSRLQR